MEAPSLVDGPAVPATEYVTEDMHELLRAPPARYDQLWPNHEKFPLDQPT